jgi:hypothetical protein
MERSRNVFRRAVYTLHVLAAGNASIPRPPGRPTDLIRQSGLAHKADRPNEAHRANVREPHLALLLMEKLKFGPFELSIGERLLRREGVGLPLGGRALDLLFYLAERPAEVIAKQELIDHVWPDRRGREPPGPRGRNPQGAWRRPIWQPIHRKHQGTGLFVRRHRRPSRRQYAEQER